MERLPDGDLVHPVPGGSNALSSMVVADGMLVVPPERESMRPGEVVDVSLF
jgi:molybdopterin biosynthesis enzyme